MRGNEDQLFWYTFVDVRNHVALCKKRSILVDVTGLSSISLGCHRLCVRLSVSAMSLGFRQCRWVLVDIALLLMKEGPEQLLPKIFPGERARGLVGG